MTTRRNEPIASWESGDAVQGFALLSRKEVRQDRNGRSYLDMELTDASGSIVAKVWGDSPALDGDFEASQFVAFRGVVKLYKEALQLSVEECREADVDELWRRLERLCPGALGRPPLARLAAETLAVHGAALRQHPAAKTMHHAYRGGLLEHVVSMAELAEKVCDHYRHLDRDLVLLGVLFHDLGKLRELGALPASDYTVEGRLVGHVVLGRDLLLERCAAIPDFPEDLRLQLEHLVLSHQGRREFSSPVEPMTAEAVVLHFIDDLDAKLNQIQIGRARSSGLQYMRGFGRYLYLDGLTVEEEEAGPGAEPPREEPSRAGATAGGGEDAPASGAAATAATAAAPKPGSRQETAEDPVSGDAPAPPPQPQGGLF